MITLSGTIYDSNNTRLTFVEIFFQSISNTGNSLNTSNKSFRTDNLGNYNVTLVEGTYRVFIRNKDTRDFYLLSNSVVVDQNTTNQTLNDLLT